MPLQAGPWELKLFHQEQVSRAGPHVVPLYPQGLFWAAGLRCLKHTWRSEGLKLVWAEGGFSTPSQISASAHCWPGGGGGTLPAWAHCLVSGEVRVVSNFALNLGIQ